MSGPFTTMVRALVAAKAKPEAILAAVEAMEAQREDALAKRRQADADRQARKREGERAKRHVTSRDPLTAVNGHDLARDPAHVEDNLQTKNQAGQEKGKEETRASAPTPQQELEAVVDAETAAAIVEHRRKLGKPLTARAARGVGKQLAKWPDPVEAANAMMANGWLSFEPEWLENRVGSRGPPRGGGGGSGSGGRRNFVDVAMDRFGRQENGSAGVSGNGGDVERLPAKRGEPGRDDGQHRGGVGARYLASHH